MLKDSLKISNGLCAKRRVVLWIVDLRIFEILFI
jgi:hypothetical protein